MSDETRMKEITGSLKQDVKDLLGESANLVTGFFKRGACTVRVMAEKWKAFAHDISGAVDTLMKPAFLETGPEAPAPTLNPEGQPIVTVTESIIKEFPIGRQMPLSEANEQVRLLDAAYFDGELTSQPIQVKIDYTLDGQTDRYWLPLEIGAGGSLLEQMQSHIDAYRADPAKVDRLFDSVSPAYSETLRSEFAPELRACLDQLATKLTGFFQRHCDIAELEQQLTAQASVLPEKEQQAFRQSAQKTVVALRRTANTGETPSPVNQRTAPPKEALEAGRERKSVKYTLRQIKEAQSARTAPPKARTAPAR